MLTVGAFDNHPDLIATGAAIALMAGGVGRALGPAISGWIYSMSTQSEAGTWGRQASWLVFLACSIPPLVLVRRLVRSQAGRKEEREYEGYDAVPLTATTRDSSDEADEAEGLGHDYEANEGQVLRRA